MASVTYGLTAEDQDELLNPTLVSRMGLSLAFSISQYIRIDKVAVIGPPLAYHSVLQPVSDSRETKACMAVNLSVSSRNACSQCNSRRCSLLPAELVELYSDNSRLASARSASMMLSRSSSPGAES